MEDSHVEAFTHVYKTSVWGDNHQTAYSGSSGDGSSIEFNKPYIAFLKNFITTNACTSVVDIGCGDFRCGPSIYDDLALTYTGYDAYEDLIRHHCETYKNNSKYDFVHFDSYAQRNDLKPADLCILKDVIQHWPNAHITTFLDFLVKSYKYKYILLCNCSHQSPSSRDIAIGDFRPLNYSLEPLNKYPLSHVFSYGLKHVYLLTCEKPNAQVIVLCASEKRRELMKQQMDEMRSPFPVTYMKASVPSNSQDFLPTNVVETYKKNLCYTRSHIRALCIAADDRSPPYTVILDDDVSLHKKDFELVIKTLCSEWTVKNIKEPMISLGWNQSLSNSNLDTIAKSCPSLGNLTNYRLIDYEFLGSIGYVVRRDSIQDILPIINKPTFAELYYTIHSTFKNVKDDIGYLDKLIPLLLRNRRVFPQVVIKQTTPSIIETNSTHVREEVVSKRNDFWNPPPPESPKPDELCFAILAKNKAGTLPFFLDCLLNQTYPKSKIHLYIRTNDNTDKTSDILKDFVEKYGSQYASVYYNDTSISSIIKQYRNHEWNPVRFKVLGQIRQDSIEYAKQKGLHYFVADCDNFITSITLEYMIAQKSLGVIAPMLTTTTMYSNYHYDIDANGYMKDHPMYAQVLSRNVRGLLDVPVVHCTYFVSYDSLKYVCYDDGSARYEYVIFSDGLRKHNRTQYLDNRFVYGFLTAKDTKNEFESELNAQYRPYLTTNFYNPVFLNPSKPVPIYKVWLCGGLGNRLFQIASVKGLAAKYKCNFEIAGYNQCVSHNNSTYKWLMERFRQNKPPLESDYDTCRSKALYKGFRSFEQLYVDHVGQHPVAVSQEHTLFYGFYQSEQYFEHIRPELLKFLAPSPTITSGLNAFETTLGTSFKSIVAIHIRLGDFLNSGLKDIHFINLESYYKRCVEDLPIQSGLQFLIVCEEPARVSSVYPTLVPFLESRGHISWSSSPSEEYDLYLLASCGTVICGNSTFAWWGSWLNQIPDKRVYHPNRWSNKRISQIDMKGAIIMPILDTPPSPTVFIYGDSHAHNNFKNLTLPYQDYHQNSITMFRVGRDNHILNFNKHEHDNQSILCFVYGEIDCRCHIQRQIDNGRKEDDVILELVTNYIKTIKNNINLYKKIIVVGVVPPTKQSDYETIHGPIKHEYPFVGTDDTRVRYTQKINKLLKETCSEYNFSFFDPWTFYTREDGTLKHELSDQNVHIRNNSFFLEQFMNLCE